MSKGRRLVSAKTDVMKTTPATNSGTAASSLHGQYSAEPTPEPNPKMCHSHGHGPCESTTSLRRRLPLTRTTARTDSVSGSSYEIICAEDRIPPSSEYFEPDAHPPSASP